MSYSILRKRKIKDLLEHDDILMAPSNLYQKKLMDLSGYTKVDYSIIENQIQKSYPQIPQAFIKEILSKNEDDIGSVINQVRQYVENNKERSNSIQEEDWEQKNDVNCLEYLIANPSIQNMNKFFLELQNEVKEKFDEKESQTFRKGQATNFILKEAVKIQKKNLDQVKIKEYNRLDEISKLENQIQQTKRVNQIFKEQIDSLEIQPQLIL